MTKTFSGITGPGEYKMRNGEKATVTGTHPGFKTLYWTGYTRSEKGKLWYQDGSGYWSDVGHPESNIIDYWIPERDDPNFKKETKVNSERINKIINEMPICADGKKKVKELIKELKPDYQDVPKVKAGQVWNSDDDSEFVIVETTNNKRQAVWLSNSIVSSFCVDDLTNHGKFLANSLPEYYEKKARGEV